jgi:sporulation protein YlmC with PRC-barrel domain
VNALRHRVQRDGGNLVDNVVGDEVAMSDTTQLRIGADASCTDGLCGEVIRVVVDPVAQAVTHLVVEPKHRHGRGRLVPLDLVDASGEIGLRCTLAEFEKLDHAEDAQFLPGSSGYAGYGPGQALSWPYYGARMPSNTNWFGMGRNVPAAKAARPVVSDSIPVGEVAVRRGEHVHATDGDIGRVQGLVINPDRHVTHVLLQDGHLFGRKEVAIPIGAVTRVDDGVRLNLTKQEVHDLPPVDIERRDR